MQVPGVQVLGTDLLSTRIRSAVSGEVVPCATAAGWAQRLDRLLYLGDDPGTSPARSEESHCACWSPSLAVSSAFRSTASQREVIGRCDTLLRSIQPDFTNGA